MGRAIKAPSKTHDRQCKLAGFRSRHSVDEALDRFAGSRTEIAGPGIPYPIPEQMGIQELSQWIPLHATLLHADSPYDFRSTATTGVAIGLDLQSPYVSSDEVRKGIAEVKEQRPYWLGDFYPLTEINTDETAWAGWQLDRQDLNSGFVTMFRRSRSTESQKQSALYMALIQPQSTRSG